MWGFGIIGVGQLGASSSDTRRRTLTKLRAILPAGFPGSGAALNENRKTKKQAAPLACTTF